MLIQYLAGKRFRDNLLESLELHDDLNPNLFDSNDKLKEDVREALLDIANEFINDMKENEIPLNVLDIWLVGSNASYNYSKTSDIDIHIIVRIDENKPLLDLLYNYAKSDFNKSYNITVKGLPVELYVEDVNSGSITNGIYSLTEGDWVKFPQPIENIPTADIESTKWYQNMVDAYKSLKDEDVQKFIDNLYLIRKSSLANEGEFGEGNLIFKQFRNNGYLDELKDRVKEIKSKELTLENKPIKEAQERTVYNALQAWPNYKQKYGFGSSFFELKYNFRLTNEEMIWILDKLISKGYIDEFDKETVINNLNLDK